MINTTNRKSLKINMILNAVKGIMGIIFPLISFPYASKVLGVDNIGKYGFANSVISYFLLLADLGISTYAIREGAKIRSDKEKTNAFASEMFSINCISAAGSLVVMVLCVLLIPKFQSYRVLLFIMSFQVLFRAIGVEWIYSVYEEYTYITIRTIFFQFMALILLFLLVKTERDINIYTGISVVTSILTNIINYFRSKKFCHIRLTFKIHYKTHIKPILILFFMNVTVSIYVASDTTILGFMCDDFVVGIYSLSTKIYSIVKTIISSVLIVSIPRLSALVHHDDSHEFENAATDIYKTMLSVMLPAILGIVLLRREIIVIAANETFLQAESSLMLLSIALFFCMGAWFWGQCILVPLGKEQYVFYITLVSATVNIFLNLILIPNGKENAAAFTTILAEGIAYISCMVVGRKQVSLGALWRSVIKVLIGCCGIFGCFLMMSPLKGRIVLYSILVVSLSAVLYTGTELLLRNEVFIEAFSGVQRRMRKLLSARDKK